MLTSSTTKLSPSSPQRTTCEYDGSSSILCFFVNHDITSRYLDQHIAHSLVQFPNLKPSDVSDMIERCSEDTEGRGGDSRSRWSCCCPRPRLVPPWCRFGVAENDREQGEGYEEPRPRQWRRSGRVKGSSMETLIQCLQVGARIISGGLWQHPRSGMLSPGVTSAGG